MTCAIEELRSVQLVGAIGLNDLTESGGACFGYWVAAWGHGRSYAAEATDALSQWAFAHGVHRVWPLAAVANVASRRTAERAGFMRERAPRGSA